MVKQKVGKGVLRHTESKSGLCFALPLLSFIGFDHFFVQTHDSFAGFIIYIMTVSVNSRSHSRKVTIGPKMLRPNRFCPQKRGQLRRKVGHA